MKATIPAKEVTICDICRRETMVLTKCLICRGDYCHCCEAIICGCVHQPKLCKRCAGIEKAQKIVEDFAPHLVNVLKARDKALRRIKPPKDFLKAR